MLYGCMVGQDILCDMFILQIESNLIWSQKSYIPRSAMFNVSVEMFGNSINLVEMGGRVQGLEKIVERFFGPEGYFSKKNTKDLIESKRQTANYISSFDGMVCINHLLEFSRTII